MTALKSFSGTFLIRAFATLSFSALVVFAATTAGSEGGRGGHAKPKLPTATPSMEPLEAVKNAENRVRPLICGPQFNIKGDQCVKKTCRTGQKLNTRGQCMKMAVKQPRAPSAAKKKTPPKKLWRRECYGNPAGNNWLGCDGASPPD